MDHSLPQKLRPLIILTEDWCLWRPQITFCTCSSFLFILFMYLNCCSLGYSHQMHILLLGEFPGETQSESITKAFFITTQTISCSITQSKLAGSCTVQSPYQLILVVILSMYKIGFNFKALFEQRGPAPVWLYFAEEWWKNSCKYHSASLLSLFFSTQTWSDFTPVFPFCWTICRHLNNSPLWCFQGGYSQSLSSDFVHLDNMQTRVKLSFFFSVSRSEKCYLSSAGVRWCWKIHCFFSIVS